MYCKNPLLYEVHSSTIIKAGENIVKKMGNTPEARRYVARRIAGINSRRLTNRWRRNPLNPKRSIWRGDKFREKTLANEKATEMALPHFAPSFQDQMNATVSAI